jgi:hypothetical protein
LGLVETARSGANGLAGSTNHATAFAGAYRVAGYDYIRKSAVNKRFENNKQLPMSAIIYVYTRKGLKGDIMQHYMQSKTCVSMFGYHAQLGSLLSSTVERGLLRSVTLPHPRAENLLVAPHSRFGVRVARDSLVVRSA